ncbi:MAG: hypothetical protein P4L83_16705 [Nevskia sp.]|nr:hypothetical protein [Nevskia sp.]
MLSRFHRRCSYAVLVLLFASGLAHFVLHRWFMAQGEFGPSPQPLEPWMLKLHGAAAMLSLVLLGSLLPGHIQRFWRLARNRSAGGLFLTCALLLIASGYGLYYVGGESARDWCRQSHIVLGLLALPAFGIHLWRGRALRRHPRIDGLRA